MQHVPAQPDRNVLQIFDNHLLPRSALLCSEKKGA